MSSKKPTPDLSGLVTTKGKTAPTALPTRAEGTQTAPGAAESGAGGQPLNFRVTADFRRRFKTLAARQDMKLNELLYRAFDEYEQRQAGEGTP